MRLLEPLNGIKTAQGHFLTHLVFFTTMFFVDTNIEHSIEIKSESSDVTAHRLRVLNEIRELGGSEAAAEVDKDLYKKEELYVFEYLMYAHLATAFFQISMIVLKKYNYFNSS
jgi:hypothetical protein